MNEEGEVVVVPVRSHVVWISCLGRVSFSAVGEVRNKVNSMMKNARKEEKK